MRLRSIRCSGRRWSKLISTITSVPPAIGTAAGCSALAASASSQLAGRRKSMTGSLLLRLVGRTDRAIRVRRTGLALRVNCTEYEPRPPHPDGSICTALFFFVSWVVQIEPSGCGGRGSYSVQFTRSALSTPPAAPHGSVTDCPKELAGQRGHLVDSYERRSPVA